MENKYTTSSVKKANGTEQKQKVTRVTKGSVKAKKKSEIASVAKSIVSDECKNIKQYILYDVVVPVIKNTLSQIITGATDGYSSAKLEVVNLAGVLKAVRLKYRIRIIGMVVLEADKTTEIIDHLIEYLTMNYISNLEKTPLTC